MKRIDRFRRRLADRFILQPTRHPLAANGLARFSLETPSGSIETFAAQRVCLDDEIYEGPLVLRDDDPPPDLLVLKFPGTGGRAERSTLFPAGLVSLPRAEVWTWNPPGYGSSTGVPTLASMAEAAIHFAQHVCRWRRGPETRLWLCGNSLGCVTSLHLAAESQPRNETLLGEDLRVDGLVLRNPPPLVQLVQQRDAWWNLRRGGRFVAGGIPAEMDAVERAREVLAPIVFIESAADTLVPPTLQQLIRDAHAGEHRLLSLAGAGHATPIDDAYRDQLAEHLRWLAEVKGLALP